MTNNTNQADVFNSATSRRTASLNPLSTVRPRNRRLISLVDDDNDDNVSGTTATDHPSTATGLRADNVSSNSFLTPTASRSQASTPSPSASRGPSSTQSSSSNRVQPSSSTKLGNGWTDTRLNKSTGQFAAEFWESSWSSLQGLASIVLGNGDVLGKVKPSTSTSGRYQHGRKPSKPDFVPNSKSGPSSWGPTNFLNKQLGSGSKEERQSMIQALKRQSLLQANGDATPDSWGNYKRRDSGDALRGASAPPPELEDADTLVYVHHVQKNDSITGVSIRYGCQPTVMRKANGFWPSDTIQARKTVLLPAKACTLKGRRLPEKEENVNLLENLDNTNDPFMDYSSLDPGSTPFPTFGYGESYLRGICAASAVSSISGKSSKQALQWKHECWVQVDGFPDAIEVGRVPRKALGFFLPRVRRKSLDQPYSDLEDNSRSPSQDQSLDTSTGRPPFLCTSNSSTRDHSVSSSKRLSAPRIHGQRSSFTLTGPGGVGTLGRNAKAPGPAEDKLNQFINTHLPTLAVPPPPPLQFPSSSSVSNYARPSIESTSTVISNSSTGLENVGGAIESWVRKMARSAKAGVTELQHQGSHLGISGMGDLIELNDTPPYGKGPASRSGSAGAGMASPIRSGDRRAVVYQSPSRVSTRSEEAIGPLDLADGGTVRGRRVKRED
ncbi:uncharacterized protein PADG_08655 [Paracoccidioides brasiliensis Pb18]|uniref:LysM domain-containing protein n=1 Tax=Paracoccidioides brasiliensis (strain Pb18) TaxID=502780 RepID=C1GMZ5_PARBD|nr:uncharacterized protein PADG_08655 [Paracoccidioides brasiliensis Pb18]EEH44997.1 hypothetical protein PADG_08655 [Paracoccidioides brasiliensis Pb18]